MKDDDDESVPLVLSNSVKANLSEFAQSTGKINRYKEDIIEANYFEANLSDFDKYLTENSITRIIISNACEQYFFSGNAANDLVWNKACDIVKKFDTTCPLIVLDPPFSVLKNNEWDHFEPEIFKQIFNCAYSRYPDATFIIFHSDKMINYIYSIFDENKITNYTLCSYYTAGKALSNYHGGFSYLAQYYTVATKRDTFNFTTVDQRQGQESSISAYMHTNFRVINRTRKSVNTHHQEVNVSEKSVVLLRSIISLFAIPTQFVIDPMCGSGSISEACTSLNISCISFDIREDQAKDSCRRINCIQKATETYFKNTSKYPPIDFPCNFNFVSADEDNEILDDDFSSDDQENDPDFVEVQENPLDNLENILENEDFNHDMHVLAPKCAECESSANLLPCSSGLHHYCPAHKAVACCTPFSELEGSPSTDAATPVTPAP